MIHVMRDGFREVPGKFSVPDQRNPPDWHQTLWPAPFPFSEAIGPQNPGTTQIFGDQNSWLFLISNILNKKHTKTQYISYKHCGKLTWVEHEHVTKLFHWLLFASSIWFCWRDPTRHPNTQNTYLRQSPNRIYSGQFNQSVYSTTQLLTKFGLCWMNMETLELKDWFVKKNTDYFKNDILDVSRAFQTRPNKPHS